MQLLQRVIAAELNASAFGSVPSSGTFAAWEAALCGTNQNTIKSAQQQAASFNTAGDTAPLLRAHQQIARPPDPLRTSRSGTLSSHEEIKT